MALEIERKFLVNSDRFKEEAYQKNYIKQGFLNSNKNRTVRIRIMDDKGFLTIKGKSNKSGTSRFEWEKEISKTEAVELFLLCEKGIIEKYRYLVKSEKHTFEVDEFLGENDGLVVAEIELSSEEESFKKPSWLGKEVTGKKKYYNSNLSKKPFCNW
ncbi:MULTISPECIES: CYTH domain-containing protein [Tenacibaculum]|uniref:CYTH domain-containing protein n=1 Tax=Tenacibaculum TaxID=104267 RepID=UPI001F0A09DE|nr:MULTISPECIES: CYTH domain-containing protein [Tenacibaculum]MCH3881530.1 CYTH domain-containing protein [Tenacibaculum aquimarinum]MDO6598875.1 CYTH domain-containing protein [Tenacibaculum sp. 1_MG-2023]